MNFIGLHTYPYSTTRGTGKLEPTTFVGPKSCLEEDGSILKNCTYPTSYASTMRPEWG